MDIFINKRDLKLRLPKRDHLREFFWWISKMYLDQRLLPTTASKRYLLELLSGEKKAIKLITARDYFFPKRYYKHPLLSNKYLSKICTEHPVISQYLPLNCKDVRFIIRLIASIEYQILVDIDITIKQARLEAKQLKSSNLHQMRVISAEAEALNGADREKPEEDSKSEDLECIEESDSLDSVASLEKTMESDDCLTFPYNFPSTPVKTPTKPIQSTLTIPSSSSKTYIPSPDPSSLPRKKPIPERVIIDLIDSD
jgi:hypothetical protein